MKEIKDLIVGKCLRRGVYKLHSEQTSSYIFDVLEVVTEKKFIDYFQRYVVQEKHLIGIEFGGSILASMSRKPYSIVRKDGSVYGSVPDEYTLVDDVCTTENSIRTAIKLLGKEPNNIITVVDRRRSHYRLLDIDSIVDTNDA